MMSCTPGHPAVEGEARLLLLRYVTLGQLFRLLKDLTPWWCGLFAVALVGAVFNLAAVPEISGGGTARQFWLLPAVAVLSWAMRGKTIQMTFPKLSFVAWALLNVCVGTGTLADALLPWWAAIPFCWGLFLLCLVFWELVGLGKATYEEARAELEACSRPIQLEHD